MRLALAVMLGIVLAGCAPKDGQIRSANATPGEMSAAFNVQVFEGSLHHPKVARYIGSYQAVSCKIMPWSQAGTKGDALQRLRLLAHRAGATGLINVQFDERGVELTCNSSVTATGDAVVLEKAP